MSTSPDGDVRRTTRFRARPSGKLEEGGALVQAREDKSWGPLIFQDLFKKVA
jgi:hypothetical protein